LSKASRRKTTIDAILDLQREKKKQYGAQRQAATGISTANTAGVGGAGGGQAVGAPSIGLLKTAGDTMLGPIAYVTKTIAGADLPAVGNNNTLDLSTTGSVYSSHVVWGAGGSDQMDIISGKQFTGQVLIIESTETLTQTITDESNVVGPPAGNIKTLDGGDLVLGTRKTLVYFMFSNIDNFWHQISNPVGGGGGIQASDNVTWTGSHIFNGPSFTVNSQIIQIGFVPTDTLSIKALLISDIIPLTGNSKSLGTSSLKWANIHGNNVVATTLTASAAATFSGTIVFNPGSTANFAGTISSNLTPTTNNAFNCGAASKKWFQIQGTNINGVNVTATGILSGNGPVFLGNSTADNITVTGRISSNFQPNNNLGRTLGAASLRWSTVWTGKINADTGVGPAGTFDGGSSSNEAIRINNGGGLMRYDANAITLSATAGFQTLPAKPVAFIRVKVGGTERRIPYYAT